MNREQYLTNFLTQYAAPIAQAAGINVDVLWRVTVGFPSKSATGSKRRRIGEHWPASASADGHHEMFISPLLDAEESLKTAVHEYAHTLAPEGSGHKAPFARIAGALGLLAPWTSTPAGEKLAADLKAWVAAHAWPTARLNFTAGEKQSTRLLKVCCPSCGYTVRVTQKWVSVGLPICPCGEEMRVQA
jgi:hypothetical protein